MHTVELLAQALQVAGQLGYRTRQEWLGGSGGGACQVRGQKWIFLDLALGPAEQLQQVLEALRHEQDTPTLPMPRELRELLTLRKSA